MGQRHARIGLLLATTSVAALLAAAQTPASAQCAINVTGSSGPVTNSNPINCITIDNATVSGNVTNTSAGTITTTVTPTGINVTNSSTINGQISNAGTITATGPGILVEANSVVTNGIVNTNTITTTGSTGIGVSDVLTFAGGISNSGTISALGAGIIVSNVSLFSGNIVNTGAINNAATGILICACTQTFAGSIINTGTINATGAGIFVEVETFTGGITNTGTITTTSSGGPPGGGIIVGGTASFGGNIVNTGTITSVEAGIGVTFVSLFSGGIFNSGSINAPGGVVVALVETFAGGIVNSGSITSNFTGISVSDVQTFLGGINNSGAITAGVGISIGCGCGDLTTFGGGITNSGAITAGITGIFVDSTVSTFLGGITNTGTISAGAIGISLGIGGISVFNSGTITGNGGTAIQFGGTGNTLTLGPGSVINGLVLGTGSDTFQLGGSSGSGTFDVSGIGPQYQGFGTFNKVDASTWTLTGANTAALSWTVLQGTLNVAASASLPNSPFTVQGGIFSVNGTVGAVTLNGGTLMGNGTLGALFANGGIVAPGNSIGQLNVNGPVTFAAGATYQVEANAAGQSDRIVATGTATLSGGTVQAVLAPGAYGPVTVFTILTANGGRIGAFSSVSGNLPFLIPSLSYDANNAFLTLTRNTAFFQNQAGTRNQRAVASALDTFPTDNPLFLAAVNLTGGATRQALDLLSGEIHASVHSVMLDDSLYLRQAVLGRLRQASFTQGPLTALGGGGPLAYAAPDETAKGRAFPIKAPRDVAPATPGPDRTWWAQGVGAWGKINGDGNAADVSRSLGGFFTGFDQRFGEWRVGIAGGYTNSSVSVSARASSANIEAAHLAAYAGTSFGAWNLRTGAAVSFDQISTSRSIVFPGFSDAVSARYHGTNGQVFGEAGYGMAFGPVAVEPFVGLAYVHIGSTSFTETGGLAALAGSGDKNDIGYSTLGARAATHVPLANGMLLTPRASLAWQHAFGDVTPTAALAFKTAGIPFTVAGAPIARNSALVDAGFDLNVGWPATFGLTYVGVLANSAHDHSVKGNFSWKF